MKSATDAARAHGLILTITGFRIMWVGVMELVGVELSGKAPADPATSLKPVGGIEAYLMLDQNNNFVTEYISQSVFNEPPGGATVGNQ